MVCRPITLHNNKHGCISWCTGCQRLNVAFGTVMFSLTHLQFWGFRKVLNEDLEHCSSRGCKRAKTISYNTDSRNVSIVLSYVELVQLNSLVNYSSLMYEALEALGWEG